MKLLLTAILMISSVLLVACGSNPYDDDPLLKPPQLIEREKTEKA